MTSADMTPRTRVQEIFPGRVVATQISYKALNNEHQMQAYDEYRLTDKHTGNAPLLTLEEWAQVPALLRRVFPA